MIYIISRHTAVISNYYIVFSADLRYGLGWHLLGRSQNNMIFFLFEDMAAKDSTVIMNIFHKN